jgi:hypothetical protein
MSCRSPLRLLQRTITPKGRVTMPRDEQLSKRYKITDRSLAMRREFIRLGERDRNLIAPRRRASSSNSSRQSVGSRFVHSETGWSGRSATTS